MAQKTKKSVRQKMTERFAKKGASRMVSAEPKMHDKQDREKWRRLTELEHKQLKKLPGTKRGFSARSLYDKYYSRKYGNQ